MKPKKSDSSRVSEALTRYGKFDASTVKKSKALAGNEPDDNEWLLNDSESDVKALTKLSDFLVDRGYRKGLSSCDDAIQTIEHLEKEIAELSRKLVKQN